MTPTMTSQIASAPEPRKKEVSWVVEMPIEIMEMFGLAEERPVTFRAQAGSITASLDLTGQTVEAGNRGPGWFVPLPDDAAAVSGFPQGSFIGVWAKFGTARVEIIPSSPELEVAADRLYNKYKDVFEELKRLGD